jgi:hypothetical protein
MPVSFLTAEQEGETEIAEPATEAARAAVANLMPGDLVDRLDDGRVIVLERGGDLEAGFGMSL